LYNYKYVLFGDILDRPPYLRIGGTTVASGVDNVVTYLREQVCYQFTEQDSFLVGEYWRQIEWATAIRNGCSQCIANWQAAPCHCELL